MSFHVISTQPGTLAQGDAESAVRESSTFDLVVLCAEEFQPVDHAFRAGLRVLRLPFDDTLKPLTRRELQPLIGAASSLADEIRRGRRVLVTCMAGRNRSGLVSALTLCRLYGMTGSAAVTRVKQCRPNALTNRVFAETVVRLYPQQRVML